ncbi:hypothetical protein F2Q69_00003653 [Brassica cretica]|uniref:Uncharacterized protein n=1 Tax=Brassica cretica TaxID=69181 RepID=A0A8S9P723_BRACR|nr:hypothetical protein F2Q69_00003653 [Brassica cretica]
MKVHESCSEERNRLPLPRKPQKSRDESNLQMMEEEEAMDDILSCPGSVLVWSRMSGAFFQYRTYRGVDDWLLTLGRAVSSSVVVAGYRISRKCSDVVGSGGSVDVVKFPVVSGGQMIWFVQHVELMSG